MKHKYNPGDVVMVKPKPDSLAQHEFQGWIRSVSSNQGYHVLYTVIDQNDDAWSIEEDEIVEVLGITS